jgi:hypothetical protein
VAISSANSTYNRRNYTVSAVKKSITSTPSAWARRNCRQVTAERRGAGSIPAQLRMVHTLLAHTRYPSRHNSPWILR